MDVVLVMFRSDGQRRSFSITRDMTIIGRREDCHLRIPLSEVSRKHCRLLVEPGQLRVQDLGSSNGTWVNGQRAQDTIINPGDTLQIGPVVFVAQIEGQPPDEELQPLTREEVQAAMAAAAAPAEDAEVPASASEPGEFDPMEALTGSEESVFDLNIENELAESAAAKSAIRDAHAPTDDSQLAAPPPDGEVAPLTEDDLLPMMPDEPVGDGGDDDIIPLEESEQDQNQKA